VVRCSALFALSFERNGRYPVARLPRGVATPFAAPGRGRAPNPAGVHDQNFISIIEAVPMQKLGTFVACAIALSSAAHAYDYKVGAIEIDHPWSRAVPKGASVAAGYLTIRNTGSAPDRLMSGSTPVAGTMQVHEMSMDNGVMRMRPVTGGLEIKPGETVELKPQSSHIMMTGLKQPIEKGKSFKGSLVFEKAGTVEVDFNVEAVGAAAPTTGSKTHDMHH
jgi:copper(I)-binding protein